MERVQEIEQRISELKGELENVEGTRTEIYTRIVGYYRSLKNWNRGKREEYDHRVTFSTGDVTPTLADVKAPVAVQAGNPVSPAIQSYQYYFRESCPNCPPVRTYVENLDLNGEMVDVDTGDGMAQAVEHQILSTPTVILMNDQGEPVAQAGSVDQLRNIMESAG